MSARAKLAALVAAALLALASLPARAGDDPPTTTTVTVERTVQGKNVDWWSRHAVQARRDANARARTIRRLSRRRWRPTVEYALVLASRVYGVPYRALRAVARCESTLNPFAVNGRYRGLLQLSWSPFGFSPFDPVASALSTAAVVRREGWRQWECRP